MSGDMADNEQLDKWEKAHVAEILHKWKPALSSIKGLELTDDDICLTAQVAQAYEQFRPIKHTLARKKVCNQLKNAIDKTILALGDAEANHIDVGSLNVDLETVTHKLQHIRRKANRHEQFIEEKINAHRPRNELLREFVAVVMAPYRRSGGEGPGVCWSEKRRRFEGSVLEGVKAALLTAGVEAKDQPSDTTIRKVAREINRAKS